MAQAEFSAVVIVMWLLMKRLQERSMDEDLPPRLQHSAHFFQREFGFAIVLQSVQADDRIEDLILKRKPVYVSRDVGMLEQLVFKFDQVSKSLCRRTGTEVQSQAARVLDEPFSPRWQ